MENTKGIEIVKWDDRYSMAYISLAVEWLEKYVSVEPGDLEIIKHPHEAVLSPGGMIWFALKDGEPVGTVTMLKSGDGIYELAKLAVTERCRGLKLGAILMETAIDFAKENGAKKVYLFTNHKLRPAIALYHKFGFQDVLLIESDMKMELIL